MSHGKKSGDFSKNGINSLQAFYNYLGDKFTEVQLIYSKIDSM